MDERSKKKLLHCHFKINPSQKVYRKRMRKIYAESPRFNTTNQKLVDHVRMIFRKGWFSDLEIQEICAQMNSKEYDQGHPTRIGTLNSEKQEPPNQNGKAKKYITEMLQTPETQNNCQHKKTKLM